MFYFTSTGIVEGALTLLLLKNTLVRKKIFIEFSTVVKMFRYSWSKHPLKF